MRLKNERNNLCGLRIENTAKRRIQWVLYMKDIKNQIENIDQWIKELKAKTSSLPELEIRFNEITDSTQHNYELIYELKDEIEDLKQEINALKLIQIMSLKQRISEKAEIKNVE